MRHININKYCFYQFKIELIDAIMDQRVDTDNTLIDVISNPFNDSDFSLKKNIAVQPSMLFGYCLLRV